jgi:hypothetical protein
MVFWRRKLRVGAPAAFEDREMKPKTAGFFASGAATGTPNFGDADVGARIGANQRLRAQK